MNRSLALNVRDLEDRGVLEEIARLFGEQDKAYGLLDQIGFPRHRRPIFVKFADPRGFWREGFQLLEDGAMEDGLEKLLTAAARNFPANPVLASCASCRNPREAPVSIITRLVVEIRRERFEVDQPPLSRSIGELRNDVLDHSKELPAGNPRRARVLHVRSSGELAPLRLEASLAEAGLRDGDVLRLSLMIDEENGPDDICPFLAEALIGFYSARVRQLRADAQRSGVDRSAGLGESGQALVQTVVQAAADLRALPDLTLLAAVRDLNETGLRTALGRLVWYGSPAEVAPEGYRYLLRRHRQALDGVWPTL